MLEPIISLAVLLIAGAAIAAVVEWRTKAISAFMRSQTASNPSDPDTSSSLDELGLTEPETADADQPEDDEESFRSSLERQIASAERRGDSLEAERLRRAYESNEEAWRAQRSLRSRAPSNSVAASSDALRPNQRGEVRSLLDRSARLESLSGEDWSIRGNSYLALGDAEQAVTAYRQALREMPQDRDLMHLHAIALQRLQRPREALEAYNALIALGEDNNAEAHSGRANALAELGRDDDALAAFDHALRLKPDDAETIFDRGRLLSDMGRLEDAITAYRSVLTYLSDNPDLHNDLGNALARVGRNEEALGAYEQAIRHRPAFARAYYNRGVTLTRIGKFEEAAEAFERCLRLRLDIPEAHYGRGVALARMDQLRDAAAAFDRAIVLRPGFADALFHKARAHSRLGQPAEALEALRQALSVAPNLRAQAKEEADFGALYADPDAATRFEQLLAR